MKVKKSPVWEINGEMFVADTIEDALSIFYQVPGRCPGHVPNYVKPVAIQSGCAYAYYEAKDEHCQTTSPQTTGVMDGEEWMN